MSASNCGETRSSALSVPTARARPRVFNLLNGFLRPDQGEILINGRDMSGRKPHELCEAGIGRTFQIMRPFLRMSISDNVVVGAYIRTKTDAEARQLATEAIARVGLSEISGRIAGELTTKELRLMELARALAGQPRILLLDETLAGLGHDEANEVVAVIQRLASDGMTIAIIEHTMQAMVRLVDSFLCSTTAPSSSRANRKPSPATTASSRPISARNGWPMLRIEGLTAGYSAIPVLNGVSIKVEQGQFVAIVGPNGAGKTTLFKTISGIVRPSAGTITFEDIDLLSVRPAQRAHLGIAHVPEGRQVFPSLTVMENLEMGAITEAGRRDWKRNIERIFEWLPVLAERRGQFAGTLSGGQQQMLAIGRGLASSPKLLMLDEPSMGLAPTHRGFHLRTADRNPPAIEPDDPAGRAARGGSAGIRRSRLRPRGRPRRARRQQPNLAGGRPRPQGLSRHVTNHRSTNDWEDENEPGKNIDKISKASVTRRTVLSGAAAMGLSTMARAHSRPRSRSA